MFLCMFICMYTQHACSNALSRAAGGAQDWGALHLKLGSVGILMWAWCVLLDVLNFGFSPLCLRGFTCLNVSELIATETNEILTDTISQN